MKHLAIALTLSAIGSTAHAATTTIDALKVPDSGVTRNVDCGGRNLTITGDNDTLTVSGCTIINVVGNHNRMTAQLLPDSRIAALGNDNHIVFLHAPGFEAQVSSSGSGNEIIPQMKRDLDATSPVKFPLYPGK